MPVNDRRGFTLVEITVSLLLLAVAILGIGASAASLLRASVNAETEALALQAVEDRISRVLLDPRYSALEQSYIAQETQLPGLEGFTRNTGVVHRLYAGAGGRLVDYREVTVTVEGPRLPRPVTRTVVVAAP